MMKKTYMTPMTRIASSIISSGMIASSPVEGDGYVDIGDPSKTPDDEDIKNNPITPGTGDALSKHRFYTGY